MWRQILFCALEHLNSKSEAEALLKYINGEVFKSSFGHFESNTRQ